jgi:HD-GYP domain-containing protein (c-di-GMP phosphodiesterase class II)
MGFPAEEVRALRRAGLLHDIGKLGVSSRILDKPGGLDAEDWRQMRRHPELTARILGQVEQLRDLAVVAAAHHERLDGSGYHLGLTAAQLSPAARVLAVADVAEALSADRPYRAGLAPDVVLEIMARDAGPKLDPDAFTALREAWEPAPIAALQRAA